MASSQSTKRTTNSINKPPRKKSRNACLQCKKRKVKCDEQAPCCRNCKYRRTPCSFTPSSSDSLELVSSSSTALRQQSSSSPVPSSGSQNGLSDGQRQKSRSPLPSLNSVSVPTQHDAPILRSSASLSTMSLLNSPSNKASENCELMHHYATTAFLSLVDYEIYKPVWQFAVPKETQSHQFVMDGLLALSALHIDYLRSESGEGMQVAKQPTPYRQSAMKHYNSAITKFRSTITDVNPLNINAVFAFSHLTIFFALGCYSSSRQNKNETLDLEDPIDEILNVFNLLRKSMDILRVNWESVQEGSMGILLHRGPAIMDRRYLPIDIVTALELMESICREYLDTLSAQNNHGDHMKDIRETYETAIMQLWDSFVMVHTKRKDWAMSLRFPIIFSDALLLYLNAREPLALIILAHYCVLLHRAPVRWWAAGWGERVIAAIFQTLPQGWGYAISWPMTVVGLSPQAVF